MLIPTAKEAYKISSDIAKENQAKLDEENKRQTEIDLIALYKMLNKAINEGKTVLHVIDDEHFTQDAKAIFNNELLNKGYGVINHIVGIPGDTEFSVYWNIGKD